MIPFTWVGGSNTAMVTGGHPCLKLMHSCSSTTIRIKASTEWHKALSNVSWLPWLLACALTLTGQCNQGERRRPLLCKWDAVERGLDSFPASIAVVVFWRGQVTRGVSTTLTVKCCWFFHICMSFITDNACGHLSRGLSQENIKGCNSECDDYSCGR